jgi:hypothetical protein
MPASRLKISRLCQCKTAPCASMPRGVAGPSPFLHTRFGLGEEVLEPYKETLDRWLWPDRLRNRDVSVAKSKTGHFQLPKGRWRTGRICGADRVFLRECCWLLQRCRLPGRRLLQCSGQYVRTGHQDHSSAICRRPRRPNRQARSCAHYQPTIWAMASAMTWTPCSPITSGPDLPSAVGSHA